MRKHDRHMRNTLEEAYAVKAKEIKAQNTARVDFYKAYLWRLFIGSVSIDIPLEWSRDYFQYYYLMVGNIALGKYEGENFPFGYSILERNRWKYPTKIQGVDEVTNNTFTIGEDCEILYLANGGSIYGNFNMSPEALIEITAQKLANADGCIDINMLVSRTPWIFECDDFADASSARAMFTQIMSGLPAVFIKRRKKDPTEARERVISTLPVKENFIAPEAQDVKRSILNEFLTQIGVNNANVDKKERLITDEVNANNEELNVAVDLWQRNADDCTKRIKELLGVDIKIRFGGAKNGLESKTDRPTRNLSADKAGK